MDYSEGLDDLDVAGYLINNIKPLAIFNMEDIRTNSYFTMKRLLKVEKVPIIFVRELTPTSGARSKYNQLQNVTIF